MTVAAAVSLNIAELIHRRALRHPERVAFETAGASPVTYGDLWRSAGAVAEGLRRAGLPRGAVAAIHGEEPAAVAGAILGILAAGAVFLPVDPRLPRARRLSMLEQGVPSAVVASEVKGEETAELLCDAGLGAVPVVVPEAATGDPAPPVERDVEGLASLYFTSGSTGVPKGIAGRLRGIASFVTWYGETLGLGAETRGSQLISPSFDGFLRDVFAPLAAGGVVCVPAERTTALGGAPLARWLADAEVSLLHCVPSVLRTFLEALGAPDAGDDLVGLGDVVVFGEVLHGRDVRRFRELLGSGPRLVNLYGPTETTLTKLFHVVHDEDAGRDTVPIGRPMRDAHAALLDARRRPVPDGTVGEIYLRTPDRALGYWRRPDKTREAFVRGLVGDDPAEAVYRTGDYGRRLPGGELEFAGRRDHQVKVRGVRVELGEVEFRLRELPGVTAAAVLAPRKESGEPELRAYVVPAGEEVTEGGLRAALAEGLPEAFVPSRFTLLPELPKLANGKVDRRALAGFEAPARPTFEGPVTPPQGPVEEQLAELWREVLDLPAGEPLDRRVDFFELGGHSLMVPRLLTRIRGALGTEPALSEIFDHSRLCDLAARLEELRRPGGEDAAAETVLPLTAEAPRDVFPASPAQERLWRREREAPGDPSLLLPLAFETGADLDEEALARAFALLARRHPLLRSRFAPGGNGETVLRVEPPPETVLTVDADPDADPDRWLAERLAAPLDLAGGRPFRAHWLRRDRGGVLLVVLHQAVADGASLRLLDRELRTLYGVTAKGRGSVPPAPAFAFGDLTRWHRRWREAGRLETAESHWRRRVDNLPEPARFRAPGAAEEGPRAPEGAPRAAQRLHVTLPERIRNPLVSFATTRGASLFMVCLAAFGAALAARLGRRRVAVGLRVAYRRPELENVVGPMTREVPFAVGAMGDGSFDTVLDQVRNDLLEDLAHDAPFFDPSPLPVLFNFQQADDERLSPDAARRQEGPVLVPRSLGALPLRRELSVRVLDVGDELRLRCDYAANLLDADTVTALLDDTRDLLGGIAHRHRGPGDETS